MNISVAYTDRWLIAMYSISISSLFAIYLVSVDVFPAVICSTFLILFSFVLVVKVNELFSFTSISFLIIFLPGFAPFYAIIHNKELFSLAAVELQHDVQLIQKVVFLYAISALLYSAITSIKPVKSSLSGTRDVKIIGFSPLLIISLISLAMVYLMEPGPTIISSNYSEILASRFAPSPMTAFTGIVLGGLWSAIFVFGRHHRRIVISTTVLIMGWLFLHSRRVELLGIFLVLLLWGRFFMRRWLLITAAGGFVVMCIVLGLVRQNSLAEVVFGEGTETSAFHKKAAIPGGISNVFLSGVHLINVKDLQLLTDQNERTMLEWPRIIIPNSLLSMLGARPTKTEHKDIYEKLELEYVGGMPLIGVFYLNGGVFFVIIFALLHGLIAKKLDLLIINELPNSIHKGGSVLLFFAFVFVVYQFRYHWYNPQTPIRAISFAIIFYFILTPFLKKIRIQSD